MSKQEILDFFELNEGYDKGEVIADILAEIKELKGHAYDEIGVEYDGKTLMTLNDLAYQLFDKTIERVCTVIKSFEDVSDPVPTIKPGDKVNYHVTTHITSAITSGCDCRDLEDVKDYIEEELFQAKHKGKESINITISSLEVVKDE